jgi:hypothetical protein
MDRKLFISKIILFLTAMPVVSYVVFFTVVLECGCGPGSLVGIVTDYGLDGPGSNPSGDEIFYLSRPSPGAHPASCKMGTRSFPGVKCSWGMLLTTHPLLVPQVTGL